ncbi:hypothetical protein DFH07DRAFT_781410 [Mycena maculata]|uniref:Uncharacterized protein n=1 Tax=Mycena maculata TaxID=230809 RepID=A0AAD7MSN5_9AGAR|nr:hypothetical protein DFH07DRAFT_781410 [Mycena maculata]
MCGSTIKEYGSNSLTTMKGNSGTLTPHLRIELKGNIRPYPRYCRIPGRFYQNALILLKEGLENNKTNDSGDFTGLYFHKQGHGSRKDRTESNKGLWIQGIWGVRINELAQPSTVLQSCIHWRDRHGVARSRDRIEIVEWSMSDSSSVAKQVALRQGRVLLPPRLRRVRGQDQQEPAPRHRIIELEMHLVPIALNEHVFWMYRTLAGHKFASDHSTYFTRMMVRCGRTACHLFHADALAGKLESGKVGGRACCSAKGWFHLQKAPQVHKRLKPDARRGQRAELLHRHGAEVGEQQYGLAEVEEYGNCRAKMSRGDEMQW